MFWVLLDPPEAAYITTYLPVMFLLDVGEKGWVAQISFAARASELSRAVIVDL